MFLLLLFVANVIIKLTVSSKYVPGYLDCALSKELFQAFNMLGSHMEFPWCILNAVQTCQYGRYGVLLSSF